jgi:pimeloyl-ACP methyl ester carboxylesterase
MSQALPERVLLLHGLWMPAASMARLALRLRQAGLETEIFAYPGAVRGPAGVVPALCRRLQRCDAVVAHSLGGLMTLSALREAPDAPVRRVVCLGSPLAGSGAARGIARHGLSAWTLGRAGTLLQRGIGAWQGAAAVGVVAGTTPLGLGRLFGRFAESNDGTVALSETRIEGLADHVAIPSSHTGLVYSARAAELALTFLRHGRFAA